MRKRLLAARLEPKTMWEVTISLEHSKHVPLPCELIYIYVYIYMYTYCECVYLFPHKQSLAIEIVKCFRAVSFQEVRKRAVIRVCPLPWLVYTQHSTGGLSRGRWDKLGVQPAYCVGINMTNCSNGFKYLDSHNILTI